MRRVASLVVLALAVLSCSNTAVQHAERLVFNGDLESLGTIPFKVNHAIPHQDLFPPFWLSSFALIKDFEHPFIRPQFVNPGPEIEKE